MNKKIGLLIFFCSLCASCYPQVSYRAELKIEGVEVSDSRQAQKLALEYYVKRIGVEQFESSDSIKVENVVTLGLDIPGFAANGDRVWELRVYRNLNQLKAIIWLNPVSEELYFPFAPWNFEN